MTELNSVILSCLILFPVLGAILVALLPRAVSRQSALAVAVINFVLSLHLVAHWGEAVSMLGEREFNFQVNVPWVQSLGINYHLGVDGISVLLVLLATFLTPVVLLASWNNVTTRVKEYFVAMLLLEAAIVGVFSALDVILFYVFYEAVLIPAYVLVGIWGGAGRSRAAIKFFIYTMAGSVLMWVAILVLYTAQTANRSFDYEPMRQAALALSLANSPWVALAPWAFGAFVIAFAIKAPIFPLHTWLPDTYSEAPTGATVIIAALLSKMGIYGFLRFVIPFFPELSKAAAPIMIALAAISIIYGSLIAIRQTDLKRLLAYSSVAHVGLIVLGVFAALLAPVASADIALSGAALQMVNHGLSTGALFLLAGLLYERHGSYKLSEYGGVATPMPRYTVLFWVALFASIGLPGLNGFVGEYLILQGAMAAGLVYAALGATGVVLGAIYMLRMFREVMYGEVRDELKTLPDVTVRETFALGAVLAVILWIGLVPQGFLNIVNPSAKAVWVAPDGQVRELAQAGPVVKQTS